MKPVELTDNNEESGTSRSQPFDGLILKPHLLNLVYTLMFLAKCKLLNSLLNEVNTSANVGTFEVLR